MNIVEYIKPFLTDKGMEMLNAENVSAEALKFRSLIKEWQAVLDAEKEMIEQ